MQWYVDLVIAHPIITAMVQFAVLGTLGDIISCWIIQKKVTLPYKTSTLLMKMLEWAILAVCIKYAFIGFTGFIEALSAHQMLPQMTGIERAFALSVFMNLQFGPFLVIMHRLLDNIVLQKKNWNNIDKGMVSLLWFWVPAHTLTFALDKPYQIGLAALWSVVLGIILGFYNMKKVPDIKNKEIKYVQPQEKQESL